MNAHRSTQVHGGPRRRAGERAPGFTLIELMIVVTIVGVLAALAVPAYQGFINKARANEGVHVLGSIGVRQESYYSEFGQYAAVTGVNAPNNWSSELGTFVPDASAIDERGVFWPTAAQPNPFRVLGLNENGHTYLAYQCKAGGPGDVGGAPHLNLRAEQFWVAAAIADLDSDGDYLVIEVTSQSQAPWMSSVKGWE